MDLAARLNSPHYQKPNTNDHYMHFRLYPTVAAARRVQHTLLMTAIHTCELKRNTVDARTSMYMLDAQGIHIDPGDTEGDVCENQVDGLTTKTKKIKLARAALIALLKVGPSVRTQGWFKTTSNTACASSENRSSTRVPSRPTS